MEWWPDNSSQEVQMHWVYRIMFQSSVYLTFVSWKFTDLNWPKIILQVCNFDVVILLSIFPLTLIVCMIIIVPDLIMPFWKLSYFQKGHPPPHCDFGFDAPLAIKSSMTQFQLENWWFFPSQTDHVFVTQELRNTKTNLGMTKRSLIS